MKSFTHGEEHLFFGELRPLQITKLPYIDHCRLKLTETSFAAVVPAHYSLRQQKQELSALMTDLYLDHGKRIINEKVYFYTQKLNVKYNRIVLKNVSSIWGSCSRLNNLNFNRRLVLAPHPIVDYVVIHEVCHLIHRNHGRGFWALVRDLCPEYKRHVRWLKDNHHLLAF